MHAGCRDSVTLRQASLDQPWPSKRCDLVVLSEVCYYLDPAVLRAVMDREVPQLASGATVLAAHWRHPVADYPMTGDHANDIIGATAGLHLLGGYQDADVAIEVFETGAPTSVAVRTALPGAEKDATTPPPWPRELASPSVSTAICAATTGTRFVPPGATGGDDTT